MFSNKKNLEILKKAFDIIATQQAAELPLPEECDGITFSAEFENKMQRLIKRQSKPYYYLINTVGKRVACIVIAALIALTSITFGVKAIRESVIEFFVETFEKFSIVAFDGEDTQDNNNFIETYYAPTYIPDGYELKIDEKLLAYRSIQYVSNSYYIEFNQNTLQSISAYMDTEDVKTELILVSGHKGFYFNKNGIVMLYWNDEYYSYIIYSKSKLLKEEIIKVAESIKAE